MRNDRLSCADRLRNRYHTPSYLRRRSFDPCIPSYMGLGENRVQVWASGLAAGLDSVLALSWAAWWVVLKAQDLASAMAPASEFPSLGILLAAALEILWARVSAAALEISWARVSAFLLAAALAEV